MSKCNFLFDALFAPALLHSSEVWGAYDSLNLKKWEKDPIERFHSQFYKSYLGLNTRAPNVAARNETGKTPSQINCPLQYNKVLASPTKASELKRCWTVSSNINPIDRLWKKFLHVYNV